LDRWTHFELAGDPLSFAVVPPSFLPFRLRGRALQGPLRVSEVFFSLHGLAAAGRRSSALAAAAGDDGDEQNEQSRNK